MQMAGEEGDTEGEFEMGKCTRQSTTVTIITRVVTRRWKMLRLSSTWTSFRSWCHSCLKIESEPTYFLKNCVHNSNFQNMTYCEDRLSQIYFIFTVSRDNLNGFKVRKIKIYIFFAGYQSLRLSRMWSTTSEICDRPWVCLRATMILTWSPCSPPPAPQQSH